jgi:HAD superfamily hydrolase (TIGR01509 family)
LNGKKDIFYMIKGLVFDFDGLILDTEDSSLRSWQEIYDEYNSSLPLEKWALCIGTGLEAFDPHAYLESLVGITLLRAPLEKRRIARHHELIALQSALPGVETYLAEARHSHLKLAVASSSPRSWVEGHLSRLGLLEMFDVLCCGDEVEHRKPDPDLYLAALSALKLSPDEAFALEDSPNGVLAAQRAGMICVAIPNPVTAQLPLDHADLRLTSMEEIPLSQLIRRVEQLQQARKVAVEPK